MEEELRKTGIDILGDVPWGTHFCQFYQTKEDLIDILVPYFKEGLENNEFCMWVTSEPLNEKEAKEAMRKTVLHFDDYLERGQIEIMPYSDWYTKGGSFNAERVLRGWVDKLNEGLKMDFEGLRLTGNTFWLEKKDWENFTDYEEEVNGVIGKYKMLAVCTYSLQRCGLLELIDVIRNHQFALVRREAKWEVVENSDRKRALDELARSEAKYRSLVENTGQGVATIDLKGRFTYVNETLCKMIGYDEEELLGKNFADFLHPDEKKKIFNLFWEVLKTLRRKKLDLEFRVVHKKGHVLYWYSSPAAFRHKGRILGFSAIISDITERKKAEEALKNSAREWHATFDAVSDSVFLTDLEGRILRCNRAMAKFLRKSFSEIIGRTYWELIHTALGPVEGRRFMSMQKSHRRETMVFSISDRYFNITVDPLLNEDGDLIGAVQIMADITERKKAEESLQKSEERYALSQRAAGVGSWEWDLATNKVEYSDKILEIWEASSSDLGRYEDFVELLHPDDAERQGEAIRDVLSGKRPYDIEYRIITPAGRVKWLHVQAKVFLDRNGKPVRMLGLTQDITQRKNMEHALRESENKLRNILASSPDPITVSDLEGNIIECNQATLDLHGFSSKEELIGKNTFDFLAPKDRQRALQNAEKTLKEGFVRNVGYTFLTEKGREFPGELSASVMRDAAGKPVSFVAITKDTTERKRAEEALRRSEERYRAVFEQAAESIVLVDAKSGELVEFNDKACENLGYTREEFKKLTIPDFEVIESVEEVARHIEKIIRQGSDTFETKHRRKDGKLRDIQVRNRAISLGGKYFVQSIWYDITERKKAEKKIKAYQKRLRALASELTLTEEREKRHLATELHDSISQLLALCRIKLGELEKVTRSSDSRSLVEEIEERLEEIIWHTRSLTLRLGPPVLYELGLGAALQWLAEYMQEQYGIQTKFKVAGEVELVDEDLRVFLFRAMQELMMNVAKHAKTDKAKILVWRENDRMRITVEDRGVGFNTADLETSSGKDTGFGLFNIREHIKYFGGELSIQSKPGEGTQVTLMVPLKVPETKT